MPSVILKITITPQFVIMGTIQNAIELLPTLFHEVRSAVGSVNCSAEELNEMEYEISQSIQSIDAWKAHLLCAIKIEMLQDVKFWKILMHGQC